MACPDSVHLSENAGFHWHPPSSGVAGGTPTNSLEQICELREGAESWVGESSADLLKSEPTEIRLDGAPTHGL